MTGEPRSPIFILKSINNLIVPLYQRNYSWNQGNCTQLLRDLVKVARGDRKQHFFGSIVTYSADNGVGGYLVIDGQQRMTTLSLLLKALCDLLTSGEIISKEPNLAAMVLEDYLTNRWNRGTESYVRLQLNEHDRAAYTALFKEGSSLDESSRITDNYRFFQRWIRSKELSPDEILPALERFQLISISLGADDNPQLIFESLNSTGLALTEGDKIRNFILMNMPVKEQEDCYRDYWAPIEKLTGGDVSGFVRDYLSIKEQKTPVNSRIYFDFKDYTERTGLATKDLLKDLLAYARLYEILLKADTPIKELKSCIRRLNFLETTITRPYFMEVLRSCQNGLISEECTVKVFQLIESYVVRRFICNQPTNALNKLFVILHREVEQCQGTSQDYYERLVYVLENRGGKTLFPDDVQFAKAFSERDIYDDIRPKRREYIMERLENENTKEVKDVLQALSSGDYSLEHIMPQKLNKEWCNELGPDHEAIHRTWLHRIANLTLTAYNSEYQNFSFQKKKNAPHGFSDSGIRLNAWIAQQDAWGLKQLEERSAILTQKALSLWPRPRTSFVPFEKTAESYSLDDIPDITGRRVLAFRLGESSQSAASWVDMFLRVFRQFYAEDPVPLREELNRAPDDSPLRKYISQNGEGLRAARKVADDLYVEGNQNADFFIRNLRRLFELYSRDASELVIFPAPQKQLPEH